MTTEDVPLFQRFRPIGEFILVQVLPEKNETPAGVLIPDIHYVHNFRRGRVLKVGSRAARHLSPGQLISFPKEHFQYGTEKHVFYMLKSGTDEYQVLKWYDALGVLQETDGVCPEVS